MLIVAISAVCSAGFLMTRVGQLAALDQQVRQLESFGVAITDDTYEQLRDVVPYRPVDQRGSYPHRLADPLGVAASVLAAVAIGLLACRAGAKRIVREVGRRC